jgi:tetratricopeptide (TPR) repeat protein
MTHSRDVAEELLLKAQQGFEAEDSVEPGDDLLIARMTARAQRRPAPEKRSRLRYFAQGALAGALATGLAMAGAVELRSRWRAAQTHEATTRARETKAPASPTAGRARTPEAKPTSDLNEAVATPAAVPLLQPGSTEPQAAPHVPLRAKESLSVPAPQGVATALPKAGAPERAFDDAPAAPASAAELFSSANRARVQGDVARAMATYRQLEATFPQSAEAGAAHLSLGVLYLQAQKPAEALAELRLRPRGSSALEAEALWSEAQALQRLGRNAEERATLQQLVKAYPGSAYVTAASRRLAELH